MKIKRINTAILLLSLAGITLTGCSNEDLANVNPQEEGAGNVSFSIVEKDYESADDAPKSRAAAEEIKPEIQDLGDGLMAEVSLVPDTTHRATAPKTRAISTPTHYTIQAFQGGVKKGELKGTFNGSTFTPDAGQKKDIQLSHGTYDFACFNDGVTANGTQLTINHANAGTARFDVQRNVLINQDPKQQVTFTMKHAGASVAVYSWFMNFALVTKLANTPTVNAKGESVYKAEFVNPAEKCKYKLMTTANAIPETMVYDITTNASTYPTMGQISKLGEADAGEFPVAYFTPGLEVINHGITLSSDYLLPTTDCSKLKVTFTGGEFYGCSLAGKSITVTEHKQVEANKAYSILVRLFLTNQYLYDDGTAGPLDKNPGKTPIAVVINPYGRVAVALQDAKDGGGNKMMSWSSSTSQASYMPVTNYSELFTQDLGTIGPAPQAVSTYTPALTGKPWCAPRFQDILYMGKVLGKMFEDGAKYKIVYNSHGYQYKFLIPSGAAATGFTPAPSSVNFPAMDMTRFNDAFTKVGGTPPSGTYWTRTECKDGTEYKMATVTISGGKFHLDIKPKTSTAKMRPFIYY